MDFPDGLKLGFLLADGRTALLREPLALPLVSCPGTFTRGSPLQVGALLELLEVAVAENGVFQVKVAIQGGVFPECLISCWASENTSKKFVNNRSGRMI